MTPPRAPRRPGARAIAIATLAITAVSAAATTRSVAADPQRPSGATPGAGAGSAAGVSMVIVDQTFELAAQDTFRVTLRLPRGANGFDATTLGAGPEAFDLRLVAFGAVTDRRDVARIRAGEGARPMTEISDTFDIPLAASVADPHVSRPAPDRLQVEVPVEAANSEIGIQLPREGVYPIRVALRRDGLVVAEALTFVHRRSAGDSTIGNLPVALLMAQTAPATIATDGTVSLSDEELADLTELTLGLEAIDAASAEIGPDAPAVPRAVLVQPATLQALGVTEPDLAARLVAVLTRSELIAAPKLPLDPSSIVAAGRQHIYTDWLREGEDIVSSIVPGVRADRSLYLAAGEVSDAAVSVLRDLDMRTLVMTPDRYEATEGSIGDFGDPTWLQTVRLAGGNEVPVLRIDPYVAARLDVDPTDVVPAAVDVLAEVMAYRAYLDDQGRSVTRTGLLLARSDGGAIDPALLREITRMLLAVDGVRLVSPGDLVATMDTQLIDGSPRPLTLPASAGTDMTARFTTIDEITFESVGTTSMLPEDDAHLDQWQALMETLPSSALTDAEVEEITAALRRGFDEFRNGVEGPSPFPFTLTGRTGTIRFRLHNTTDVELTVKVRLDGAKLTFPTNDLLVTLPPQSQTPVAMVAESKSNGTSQVIVRVLSPSDAQIVPDVVLTAQVRALTGLGQLLTGAGLLVLATWWVRHWRKGRRRAQAIATSDRHPAVRGNRGRAHIADAGHRADEDDHASGGEHRAEHSFDASSSSGSLAPDAAASSLPPS